MSIEEAIKNLKTSQDADIRRISAEELGSQAKFNKEILEALSDSLLDEDLGVKDTCSRILSNIPVEYGQETASVMVHYIAHRDIEIRNLAGDILNSLGSLAQKPLLPYLKNDDYVVRQFALDILGHIGNSELLDTFYDMFKNDSNINVKNSALEAIGNICSPDSLQMLFEFYDLEEDLKPTVIEAIGKIGGEKAEDFLIKKQKEEEDLFLQTACIDALAINCSNIKISDELLNRLTDAPEELKPIILKTIYTIANRADYSVELPLSMRYIAQNAMFDTETDIKIAALFALGENYIESDLDGLVNIILDNESNMHEMIFYNLLTNSQNDVVEKFFTKLADSNKIEGTNIELLSFLPVVSEKAPKANILQTIDTLMQMVFTYPQGYSTEIFEILMRMDYDSVITNLKNMVAKSDAQKTEFLLDIISTLELKELTVELEILSKNQKIYSERIKEIIESWKE